MSTIQDKLVSEEWKKENGIYIPPTEAKVAAVVKAEFELKIKGFNAESKKNDTPR